jgi:hypothetical protein
MADVLRIDPARLPTVAVRELAENPAVFAGLLDDDGVLAQDADFLIGLEGG